MSVIAMKTWVRIAGVDAFPTGGGTCAKVGDQQIAIFNTGNKDAWYACENRCPHRGDMVLGRGLTGDLNGEPKVACPQHKKAFSLKTGACLTGEEYCLETFAVKVEEDVVFIQISN